MEKKYNKHSVVEMSGPFGGELGGNRVDGVGISLLEAAEFVDDVFGLAASIYVLGAESDDVLVLADVGLRAELLVLAVLLVLYLSLRSIININMIMLLLLLPLLYLFFFFGRRQIRRRW